MGVFSNYGLFYSFVIQLILPGFQFSLASEVIQARFVYRTTAEGEITLQDTQNEFSTNSNYDVRLPREVNYEQFNAQFLQSSDDVVVSVPKVQRQFFELQNEEFPEKLNLKKLNFFVTRFCGQKLDQFQKVDDLGATEATVTPYFEAVATGSYSGLYRPVTEATMITYRIIHPKVRTLLTTTLYKTIKLVIDQQLRISQIVSGYRLANNILIAVNQLIDQQLPVVVANIVSGYKGATDCLADRQGQIGGVVSLEVGQAIQYQPELLGGLIQGFLDESDLVVDRLSDETGVVLGGGGGKLLDDLGGSFDGVSEADFLDGGGDGIILDDGREDGIGGEDVVIDE